MQSNYLGWETESFYEPSSGQAPGLFDDTEALSEALRKVVDDPYRYSDPEVLQDALFDILERLDPAEGISLTQALRAIGGAGEKVLHNPEVGQVARTVLPVAGTVVGGMYGGPAGAAIGGKLGQAGGSAFSGGQKPAQKTAPSAATPGVAMPNAAAPSPAPGAATPIPGGSAAARQILHLAQNTDMLKSLVALMLGPAGQKSIQVGQQGPSVSPAAFMNLLSVLAGQAAADAEALLGEGEELSDYLLDSEGEFRYDPASPEERAQALYERLEEAEELRLFGEDTPRQAWSNFFPFGKGAQLLVEYDSLINFNIGRAYVIEHTPNLLKVKLHIDPIDRLNLAETTAVFAIEYRQEGSGNRALVSVDGQATSDNNLAIHSSGNTREMVLSVDLLGQRVDKVILVKDNPERARLKLRAQQAEYALILSRR